MRKRGLLTATIIMSLALIPQYLEGWTRTYGGINLDKGKYVEVTSDGGYIIGGSTESSGKGESDAWLIKTDRGGNVEWERTYGESHKDYCNSVHQTSDGGYIFAGATDVTGEEQWDGWLVKTDAGGNTQWSKTYGGGGYEWAASVVQASDGGYVVAGTITPSSKLGYEIWLFKTDEYGEVVWENNYGTYYDDHGYYVTNASDGGYLFTGHLGDFNYGYVFKANDDGDTVWSRRTFRKPYSVCETSDGGLIVCGEGYTPVTGVISLTLDRFDEPGERLWRFFLQNAIGYSVCEASAGSYVATGYAGDPNKDLVIIKVEEVETDTGLIGSTLWKSVFGGASTDEGYCVQKTPDGGYIAVGWTLSYGAGSGDVFLVKIDADGNDITGVEERPASASDWQITSSIGRTIVLSYSCCPEGFCASVYDALGCKVDEVHSNQTQGTITWGESHSPGVYFIVPQGLKTNTLKVILVR